MMPHLMSRCSVSKAFVARLRKDISVSSKGTAVSDVNGKYAWNGCDPIEVVCAPVFKFVISVHLR